MHCNLRETLEELLQYRQGGNVSLVVREDCVPSSTHDVLVLAKTNQKSNGRSGKVPSSGNRKNDLDSLLNEIARTRCSNSGNRTRRDGSDEGKRQNPRKLEQLIASTDAQNGKEMLASLVHHHFDEVEDDGDADSDSHRLSVFARFCSWLQNGFCPRERTFPLHSQ
jgi:hypothetical protein